MFAKVGLFAYNCFNSNFKTSPLAQIRYSNILDNKVRDQRCIMRLLEDCKMWPKLMVPYFKSIHFASFLRLNLEHMSQLMRLWYLSHRRPANAQASLRIRAVSPEPSLVAHMKYGSRQRVRQKIRHLAPLDGCACAFKDWVYGGWKVP